MRGLRIAAWVAPIAATAFIVWREQTLEHELAGFVAKTNAALQEAMDGVVRRANEVVDEYAGRMASLQ